MKITAFCDIAPWSSRSRPTFQRFVHLLSLSGRSFAFDETTRRCIPEGWFINHGNHYASLHYLMFKPFPDAKVLLLSVMGRLRVDI
jgi:hypothetical protein